MDQSDRDQTTGQPRRRNIIRMDNLMYDAGDDNHVQMRHPPRQQQTNGYGMGQDPTSVFDAQAGEPRMEYDHAMAELINQLPSRQLEDVAEMASRTLLRNRHSSHRGTVRLHKDEDIEDQIVLSLQQDLDNENQVYDDIDAAVRTIPTTLSRKRNIKHRLSSRKRTQLTRCKLIQYWFGMFWQHTRYKLRKTRRIFDLWRSHLMVIEGCFGTSVVSYFIFLKWVLLINIPIFLLTFSFLVIPQILYRYYQKRPPGYEDQRAEFTGIELLTGGGFFENSEMYYGFYTNETVEIIEGQPYQMKYAYLFTCGGYYLFCLIILGYSYLRSYRTYYIEARGSTNLYYINLILNGWDYGITSQETAQLKHRSIRNELKEYLSGVKNVKKASTRDELAKKWCFRLFMWTIVLALLAATGYATYEISTELSIRPELANSTSIPVVSPLAMPVVISSIQLIIPMVFTLLESYEDYSKPQYELYVHMFREMALKATMLSVLVYFWLQIASSELKNGRGIWYFHFSGQCWETFVGQEIYRLTIIDLLFCLGYSFFMEFIRKLLSLKWPSIQRAEVAVGRNTLELIYSQCLCWLGIFYSPLLPVVVILKLIIVFYVKRYSVVYNCRPSLKPWRASRTHTIFVGYLFMFFILTCIAVGCSVFLVRPSKNCGPYQNYTTSSDVVSQLIDSWRKEERAIGNVFDVIGSPGFVSGVLVFLCMILYYTRAVMLSHKKQVEQFRLQLQSEGKDKKFLMDLLNQVKVRGRRLSRLPGPTILRTVQSTASKTQPSPGGKVFIKTIAENLMTSPAGQK